MSVVNRRVATLLLPIVMLGGCGFLEDKTEAEVSTYPQGRLCAEFTEFVKNELSINADYRESAGSGDPIKYSAGCTPAPVGGTTVGQLMMSRSLEEGAVEPEEPGYKPQKGFDEKVWMASDNKFRVQVGRWVGVMELYRVELTNDQTRKAIEFLIRETRAVRG